MGFQSLASKVTSAYYWYAASKVCSLLVEAETDGDTSTKWQLHGLCRLFPTGGGIHHARLRQRQGHECLTVTIASGSVVATNFAIIASLTSRGAQQNGRSTSSTLTDTPS